MPFKIRLKKSRQYNVTSKSLFVISVYHLLDTSTAVDCTLSSESTGYECIENVCSRLSINQSEFFGLRYIVKATDDEQKWIDLERPLSRQLEKYAAKTILFLRIMYYVSPAALIIDEVTRYYFYLQLKSDVVDSRINCDTNQAIILASYCRQAEYDSHQREKHTVDYLKSLLPIPKPMIDAGLLEMITSEVLQYSMQYHNLSQSHAEEQFIATCQQLNGFGQETFTANNRNGMDVVLGVSFQGISIVDDEFIFYPWHTITNIIHLKKSFNIECADPEKSLTFTFNDSETAHYIWKLTALQHKMHAKCKLKAASMNLDSSLRSSKENLIEEQHNQQQQQLQSNLQSQTQLSHHHSSQQIWPENHISAQSEQSIMASNLTLANSSNLQLVHDYPYETSNPNLNWAHHQNGSNTSLNNNHQQVHQSTSCLDLSNNNLYHENEMKKAMLPVYRPAPDYETAMRQKYMSGNSNELRMSTPMINVMPNEIVSDQHLNIYAYESQNDIHQLAANQLIRKQHYPDVTQTTNSVYAQAHIGVDTLGQPFKLMRLTKQPPSYPVNRISSTSTPDLALASQRALLGYHGVYVSGSSPDLVSTRNFGRPSQYHYQKSNPILFHRSHQPLMENQRLGHSQGYLPPHGTFEHLNIIDHPNYQNQQAAQQQQQQGDYGSKLIYCMPGNIENIYIQDSTINTSQQHINGVAEPIYQNVPLGAWQNDAPSSTNNNTNNDMRNRTSSVQSAPGNMKNITIDKMLPKPMPVDEQHHHQIQIIHSNPNQLQGTNDILPPPSASTSSHEINSNLHELSQYHHSSSTTNIEILAQSNNSINSSSHNVHQAQAAQSTQHHQQQQQHVSVIENDFSQMNISGTSSTMFTDSSQASTNVSTDSTKTEKKKRRWGILNRAKLGGSKNSDKQKSATLGREKGNKTKEPFSGNDDTAIRHRWSTGLPKSQSLPTDISKEKLCQLLEGKLADEKLFIEFEQIPKRKEHAKFDCALHDENRNMNYDPDFLPYDDNRVKITPNRENRLGYVNASHITATVGSKQRFYIVAQSPMNILTCNTFWNCVWEADVYLIIQLSDDLKYMPKTSEKHIEYGQVQVWQEFSQETDRCVTSKLRLYHTQNRRFRSVWHLSYLEWNEQNCPKNVMHFLDFLEELNSVRIASIAEVPPGHNTNPPVLIHCNGGGGRAGVTLASDLLLYTLDHNQALNIPECVKKLSEQRDKIIPSLAQYKFIYALLIHYLKRNRLI